MDPETAVEQMMLAHCDFEQGRGPRYSEQEIVAEQRPWYENTEFRAFDPCQIESR